MTEVEKWMLKHYTQDLDSMKCNYCQEIFSDCNQMQNLKYHLGIMHNVLELNEHPEYDNIQKNYNISSPTATCNHCKKTINLAIHGVHVLTIHLKIFHSDEAKNRISRARDKYDITGDKATCKGCKKTLKISNIFTCAASLRRHIHDCPETTEIIRQKTSLIWDKYDTTGNNATCATCKGCKKTIKIARTNGVSSLHKHLHYCPYFKTEFPLKITKQIRKKKRTSHIWEKYDVTGSNATCKGCKKTVKISRASNASNLHMHLHYCPHFKNDFSLNKEIKFKITQKKSHIWNKYDITDNNIATCKGCKKTLKAKVTSPHAGNSLRVHLSYCPHFKNDFPLKKNKITKQIKERKRSVVWDRYDVIDSNATCKGCKKTVKVTKIKAVSLLRKHLHYCPHFKTDFPLKKNKITRQTKGKKRSHVWEKYDVIGSNGTCKGCKKTIKITRKNPVSILRKHLYYCPYFKTDFPLKKNKITNQINKKRSHVWDKYDVTASNATCKGCKKTVKIPMTSKAAALLNHLYCCPYFKTDFSLKKNEITKQIKKKTSHVWDKYDVTASNATCKGCKKTVKISRTSKATSLLSHLRYCPHFKTDFPLKKERAFDITQKKSHIWNKYDITDNNIAICKGCKKTLKIKVTSIYAAGSLRHHFQYCPHFNIDIPEEREIYEITPE